MATDTNGEPSATDFLLLDLPTIAEAFALRFDQLPKVFDERDDYRVLSSLCGRLVCAALIVGQVDSDGSIELIAIDEAGPHSTCATVGTSSKEHTIRAASDRTQEAASEQVGGRRENHLWA